MARVVQDRAVLFWSCFGSLGLIGCHHLFFSISPDSSFVPSMVLACLPLWALTVALLKNPHQLWVFVSLLVVCFALLTTGEFLLEQQRAHAPLRDPGNYLTLLYLVGIPWVLFALKRDWSVWQSMLGAFLVWTYALAMLATHMRFGMLVVIGMLAGLLLTMVLRFDVKKRPVLFAATAIGIALVSYAVLDLPGLSSSFAENSSANGAANPRLLIWQSAWQALVQLGGVNGTGLYTFSILYPLFRSPFEQGTSGILVHNDLLQLTLEGGVWLAVPLLALFGWVAFAFLQRVFVQRSIGMRSGMLLALVVAFIHSCLNFVFYVLPLVILVGLLLGLLFGSVKEPAGRSNVATKTRLFPVRVVKSAMVALLTINLFYLCLDVLSLGVLTGNKLVPGASQISSNPATMQGYVQWAQTMNARRGLPVFAEANLLEQQLGQAPTPLLMSQTDLTYQRAIELDPWNPAVRTSYAQFRSRYFTEPSARAAQESKLYGAFKLNRANLNTNLILYRWHQTYGTAEQQREIAANIILWCKLMARHPAASDTYAEIEAWATDNKFSELGSAARRCQGWTKRSTGGGRKKTWFMRWMEATSGPSN